MAVTIEINLTERTEQRLGHHARLRGVGLRKLIMDIINGSPSKTDRDPDYYKLPESGKTEEECHENKNY